MIDCRRASYLLSEKQDQKLSYKERISLTLHLMLCIDCRRYRKQLKLIRSQIKNWQK